MRIGNFFVSNRQLFGRIPFNNRLEYECVAVKYRIWQSQGLQLQTHTVYTFAIFLHITIISKESCNFRIPGKVRIPDIILPNHTSKGSRTVYFQSVIEHLYLNVSTFYTIVSVRYSVYNNFCANELSILFFKSKNSIIAQICSFFHLSFNVIHCITNLIQNAPSKTNVFYDVHIVSYFGFVSIISNKSDSCTREKLLWVLSKKKNCSDRDLFEISFLGNKAIVLSDVFFRSFSIPYSRSIFSHKTQIDIVNRCAIDGFVLVGT